MFSGETASRESAAWVTRYNNPRERLCDKIIPRGEVTSATVQKGKRNVNNLSSAEEVPAFKYKLQINN